MSKYPNFDRVTAGRLRVGDTILVRDGHQDLQCTVLGVYNPETHQYDGRETTQHGTHRITAIGSELHRAGRKSSRYYTVTLDNGQSVVCSSVQRWNRVVS